MSTFKTGRSARVVAAFAAIVLATSACGSSDSKSESTTAGGEQAQAGIGAASAFLAKYSKNPTSIGLTTPLSAKPEAGKDIISLTSPIPTGARLAKAVKHASEALDWNFSEIGIGTTPASAAGAFEAAIARRPDAILFVALPASLFTKQIADAKSAGITVISAATGDNKVDGVIADLGGISLQQVYGKLVAADFVARSEGKGKAALLTMPAYPVLRAFSDSFQAAVKDWCSGCSVEVLDQQVTDVGTKTPTNVVGKLQRDRSTTWLVVANGDLAQGVGPALQQAGLADINIIGEIPTQANIADVKSGKEQAWAGYPIDMLGWRIVDTLARHFGGGDVKASMAVQTPLQLINTDNVNDVVLDDQGFYIGVADYADQFKKLWLAGGAP